MNTKYRFGDANFQLDERRTCDAPPSFMPHFHDYYEILFCKEGEGHYIVEGKTYEMKSGDIFLTNPRELHYPVITSTVYDRVVLIIYPQYLCDFITKSYNPFNGIENRSLASQNRIEASVVSQYGLDNEIELIRKYYNGNEPCKYAMVKSRLFILLEGINQIIRPEKNVHFDERIQEIIHFINDNITEKLTLQSIAEKFFIDKFYLSHLFRDKVGMPLTDYITSKRILLSLELMTNPIPLLDVAFNAGFMDYASFYRAFLRHMRVSPREYRKSSR